MADNTINDEKTTTDDGKGAILAARYRILRRLGQGGMGSVWLAEDLQLDNRKVAIKMLPSIIVTDKRAYNQLKGEALVSLKLIHPNIVTLRAFEENNGAPFLVMDYIEGRTLSDYLAENGKLSEAETIKLLKPIAAALDYAHGEKVIHRDVKPSNIIIRNDGHPFILDFGIAREIQESLTRMTGGTISGTLLYMSPEQLRGAPPAPSQDVYSFAAMCYECLSGNPPFTKGEIAYQIINEKPDALVGSMSFVGPIMAGLAKNPADRPKQCIGVLGAECVSQKFKNDDVPNGLNGKSLRRKTFALASFLLAVVVVVLSCWGFSAYRMKRATRQFLAAYDAKQYDVAASLIGKVDDSVADVQYRMGLMYSHGDGVSSNAIEAITWYRRAAEQGHGRAQFNLGWMYFDGNGVKKDKATALKWWRKAAEQGLARAQGILGFCYANGQGVATNLVEAISWYKKAAAQGESSAQFELGKAYAEGRGVRRDDKEAMELFKKAASQGDANAQYWLGQMNERNASLDTTAAWRTALTWYRKAAEQGHVESEYKVGYLCYMLSGKFDEAAKWYGKAAEKNHPAALGQLGGLYENGWGVNKNIDIAIQCYKKAAALGDDEGQYLLALKYYYGDGVVQNYPEAARLFRLSAEQGNIRAPYQYALMCLKGKGLPRDLSSAAYWFGKAEKLYRGLLKGHRRDDAATQYALATILMYKQGSNDKDKKEAIVLYRNAAELGSVEAQSALGWEYLLGKLVDKNVDEAFKWTSLAAKKGNVNAQNLLGTMYNHGDGVEKNAVEAARWFKKAAEQGDGSAQENLAMMYFDGRGVKRDDGEALRWLFKAAEQQSVIAFSLLGWAYENGRGVNRDIVEAAKWYRKVEDLGYKDGKQVLDCILKK